MVPDALVTGTGNLALCWSLVLAFGVAYYGWMLLSFWGAARFAEDDAGSGRWLVQ